MVSSSTHTNLGDSTMASGVSPATASLGYREAFQRCLPEIQALSANDLLPINVDIPTAVTTAVGALPEILNFRARILNELPQFDLTMLESLEMYTLATGQAHALYLAASTPPEHLTKLADEGAALRDTLFTDATALAKRGLLSGDRLGESRVSTGYKNVAFDLLGLSAMMRQNWQTITMRTAVQLSELDRAEWIAEQIISEVGAREQAPQSAAETSQQRQRAFTLFARAYDQVRRAITYLRWNEEDVDDVAPSLYAGRRNRKKSDDGTTDTAPTPPATTAPNPPAAQPPKTLTAPDPATHAVGLPGSNPFAVS